ncbi:hypothetical protein BDD12DRAFT_385029 [Trichophaea hybrida]|nr:hypothetical protein BDD12DRAFT_385029 [Trichophaea hybrida]
MQTTEVFSEDDNLDTTIEKILHAPDEVYIEALVEAIKKAGIEELTIVVDGLSEDIAELFDQHSRQATRKLKCLFKIDKSPKYGELTYIEYDKERQECLRSLNFDNTRYDKISEEHHGSLEWLWKHPQYLKWSASATSSLLYIEGKPGSGKSTLAKYLLKNLEKVPNARSSTVAYYFYTLRGTVLESTHKNMLRSILYSILRHDEAAFFHFQQEFRDYQLRNHSEWPYESLKKVLSSFAHHPPTKPLYLILDAMDESIEDDRRNIIQLLCQLCSEENPCRIKIFLASRPSAELQHRIQNNHFVITLQDENEHDITRFADDFLKNDLSLTGKILDEAAHYVTANAQGVFVWVGLVKIELVGLIETGCTNAEILACLKCLPTELEDFYAFMFDRLESGKDRDIKDGIRLFRLVLIACRPLTVVELRHALAILDRSQSYEEFQNNIISAIERRIVHCGGNFLEIKTDETVHIMHQTARDFLIRTIPDASKLHFNITDKAHKTITTMSVRYLMLCLTTPRMQDDFAKSTSWSPSDFRDYAEYLNEWPLIEYICRYIKDHLDQCERDEEVSQLVMNLIRQMADNQASYFLASFLDFRLGYNKGQEVAVDEHQETSENIIYNTFNAAAEPKLPHVVKKTPLIISAQKGLVGATKLFLWGNIEKDAQDNLGRTALHYAAENGSEAIVRLLTEQKANKQILDNNKKTALHIAVEQFP